MSEVQRSMFAPEFKADFPADDARLVQPNQLERFYNWLEATPVLFIDYETRNLKPTVEEVLCIGGYTESAGPKVADSRYVGVEAMRHALTAITRRKPDAYTVAFNCAFEDSVTRRVTGKPLGGVLVDPMHQAFAYNELSNSYTQKNLVKEYLGLPLPFAAAVDTILNTYHGGRQDGWHLLPASLLLNYNCEDLETGFKLYKHLTEKVIKNGQWQLTLTDAKFGVELELIKERGIEIDADRARGLIADYTDRTVKAKAQLFQALDYQSIDIASHTQLFGLIYGQLKLPMHADIEKSGKLDKVVFEWLKSLKEVKENPRVLNLLSLISDIKELDKLLGTYLIPWLYEHAVRAADGALVLPANINMRGAETRRCSSEKPNLQNVPTRTELGAGIREAFVSRHGFTTYTMDLSQAEYRAFTHYSGEKMLIDGYLNNPSFDIHVLVSEMLHVPRKKGKNLNFGQLYGMGKDKLSRELQASKEEAEQLLNQYHKLLPGVKRQKKTLDNYVAKYGVVRDIHGGTRHLTRDESYKALNSLCQMTVANIIRRAMVLAGPIIRSVGGNMLLQVHDDMHFELPGTDPREHAPIIKQIKTEAMENVLPGFKVPFTSDCEVWSVGSDTQTRPNWAHAVEYTYAH